MYVECGAVRTLYVPVTIRSSDATGTQPLDETVTARRGAHVPGRRRSARTDHATVYRRNQGHYYEAVKRNLSAMVEKILEEHFTFRPVTEVRSFAESVAQVADAQARNCNLASGGGSKTLDADKKQTKAELLAALKESFGICDAAFAALTDA
jgi:hypothetical protein